jgi:hypothetical protein
MLGDIWAQEPQPEDSSMLSMDYYRNKVREFQTVLNGVESAYQAAISAVQSGALTEESKAEIFESLNEFGDKYRTLKLTAETINAGAAAVNAAGGRFPELSIPRSLGALPVIPLAMVAAVATAATLISWGVAWIAGLNERLKRAQLLEAATPEQRAKVIEAAARTDNALATAQSSPLSMFSDILKYGAILLGGYLLWRAYSSREA